MTPAIFLKFWHPLPSCWKFYSTIHWQFWPSFDPSQLPTLFVRECVSTSAGGAWTRRSLGHYLLHPLILRLLVLCAPSSTAVLRPRTLQDAPVPADPNSYRIPCNYERPHGNHALNPHSSPTYRIQYLILVMKKQSKQNVVKSIIKILNSLP